MSEKYENEAPLEALTLGKVTEYKDTYAPELLQAVPRSMGRRDLNLPSTLPFNGTDRWNGYELSWLNRKGKPQVAILRCEIPASSPNLIESKSFKLYLNSFNQTHYESADSLTDTLSKDLSACAEAQVQLSLITPSQFTQLNMGALDAISIDDLDIEIKHYQFDTSTLQVENTWVKESLTSDLLKSNCLITNQPDWGSVLIRYEGNKIDREGLLRYFISFRQHNEFHEQCVERIFYDIMRYCSPRKLTVYARYTRRGGLDINPFRSNFEDIYPENRLARQ